MFFKFTGAPESVHIFTTLGVEPWGRYASGIVELIAVVLPIIPATRAIGGAMAVGVMAGAILSHLTFLGVAVPNVMALRMAVAVHPACDLGRWRGCDLDSPRESAVVGRFLASDVNAICSAMLKRRANVSSPTLSVSSHHAQCCRYWTGDGCCGARWLVVRARPTCRKHI